MSMPNTLILAACLGAALLAPVAQQTPSPSVTLVEGGSAVKLVLTDMKVADFVAAAQPILGVPIQSMPDEVVPPYLHQSGEQTVALKDFRDAFDAVLRREGFWTWDDTTGGSPVIVVRKELLGKFLGKIPFTAPVITLEELAAGPSERGPQYTTLFKLTHVSARDLLMVVASFLDSANETVRHVEGANQLLVTASREHLLAIRDALAGMDVPGPQSPGVELQVSELATKVADLERRLTALEKSKAGG